MRLVFMGTPSFAVPTLAALHEAGHEVALVVTQPDKPKGRGMKLAPPPVKEKALELGLGVFQPERVKAPEAVEALANIAPDAIVVAAFGQILPKTVLDIPKSGCYNVHASLLPKYRGAAPINWAIINGEESTGVTIMKMDVGMDTGEMLLKEDEPILPDDTAGTLTERLAAMGARLMVRALEELDAGVLHARGVLLQRHQPAPDRDERDRGDREDDLPVRERPAQPAQVRAQRRVEAALRHPVEAARRPRRVVVWKNPAPSCLAPLKSGLKGMPASPAAFTKASDNSSRAFSNTANGPGMPLTFSFSGFQA